MDLNCAGPLICGFFFSINILKYHIIQDWLNLQLWNYGYRGLALKSYVNFQLCDESVPHPGIIVQRSIVVCLQITEIHSYTNQNFL